MHVRAPPPSSLLLWLAEPARRGARLRVLRDAPSCLAGRGIAADLTPAAYQQSADQFFSQLAAGLRARGRHEGNHG